MFGISFGEILLIVTVGLIIVGPKRLPETARFIGHLFSRVHRQVNSVKADIRREMDLEDIKNIHREYEDATKTPTTFSASGGTYGQRSGRFTQKNACNGYD